MELRNLAKRNLFLVPEAMIIMNSIPIYIFVFSDIISVAIYRKNDVLSWNLSYI